MRHIADARLARLLAFSLFWFLPLWWAAGPGLGGHCIPIDPFYLTWKAHGYGKHTRFIELAGEINTQMPEHVVHRVADALNAQQKPISGSKILILGLAYKPNVDDDRESPSYVLMNLLSERGAEADYYDPYVPLIKPTREHSQFAGKKSVEWNQAVIEGFDLVLIATNHACVNYQELGDWARCIVDKQNAMAGKHVRPGKVWKA
jgi:UDP-N-acetyl-D-glucosamine dehydrogenase